MKYRRLLLLVLMCSMNRLHADCGLSTATAPHRRSTASLVDCGLNNFNPRPHPPSGCCGCGSRSSSMADPSPSPDPVKRLGLRTFEYLYREARQEMNRLRYAIDRRIHTRHKRDVVAGEFKEDFIPHFRILMMFREIAEQLLRGSSSKKMDLDTVTVLAQVYNQFDLWLRHLVNAISQDDLKLLRDEIANEHKLDDEHQERENRQTLQILEGLVAADEQALTEQPQEPFDTPGRNILPGLPDPRPTLDPTLPIYQPLGSEKFVLPVIPVQR